MLEPVQDVVADDFLRRAASGADRAGRRGPSGGAPSWRRPSEPVRRRLALRAPSATRTRWTYSCLTGEPGAPGGCPRPSSPSRCPSAASASARRAWRSSALAGAVLRDAQPADERREREALEARACPRMTANVRKMMRLRAGNGRPSARTSGSDRAAASDTTPRIPAQPTTSPPARAGYGCVFRYFGKRNRGRYAPGNIHTSRTTTIVAERREDPVHDDGPRPVEAAAGPSGAGGR